MYILCCAACRQPSIHFCLSWGFALQQAQNMRSLRLRFQTVHTQLQCNLNISFVLSFPLPMQGQEWVSDIEMSARMLLVAGRRRPGPPMQIFPAVKQSGEHRRWLRRWPSCTPCSKSGKGPHTPFASALLNHFTLFSCMTSCARSLSHSLTHPLDHSLTHSRTHSLASPSF